MLTGFEFFRREKSGERKIFFMENIMGQRFVVNEKIMGPKGNLGVELRNPGEIDQNEDMYTEFNRSCMDFPVDMRLRPLVTIGGNETVLT